MPSAVDTPAPPAPADAPAGAPPVARCAECEADLAGPFCHRCGQRAAGEDDLTLARFVRSGFHEVAGTDARLVRSLWTLVRYPGRLTREFVDGHRQRWTSPVQLFLLASAAYFLFGFGAAMEATDARRTMAAQIVQTMRAQGLPADVVARAAASPVLRSDALYEAWGGMMAWGKFGNLALFALAAWALHRRRVRGGLPAVTFALHYYAFDFLLFTLAAPLFLGGMRLAGGPIAQAWLFAPMPFEIAFLWLALRRAYGGGRARTTAATAALLAVDVVGSGLTSAASIGLVLGRVLAGNA